MMAERTVDTTSASPQLEDGHLRIANELYDAILRHGFSGRQLLVLMAVIRNGLNLMGASNDIQYIVIGAVIILAVTIDVGAADDIHPRDKRTVGHRLALPARRLYGDAGLAYSGPVFRDAEVRGAELVLRFDAQRGLLAVRGGGTAPRGFELAGDDGRFHPAQARIAGDTVVLRSDAVRKPAVARYAWSDNPVQADLVGADGLPAGRDDGQARLAVVDARADPCAVDNEVADGLVPGIAGEIQDVPGHSSSSCGTATKPSAAI